MLIEYPSISSAELEQAKSTGKATLSGLAIDQAVRKLYSSPENLCIESKAMYSRMTCLYLYLYAADSWCEDGCNSLTDEEFTRIIAKIEELQQQCCDFRITGELNTN